MTELDPTLPHQEVRRFLSDGEPGPVADVVFAGFLGLPPAPYTTDPQAVTDALDAIHAWWHVSHIQAEVILTQPADGELGGFVSNAAKYDKEGNAISYATHRWSGESVAWSLCRAWLMCVYDLPPAYFVNASHSEAVLSEPIRSERSMMAYYRARERHRQDNIRRWEKEHGTAA